MTQDEKLEWLIEYLLKEDPAYSDIEIPADRNNQWLLLRSLMNIRPAKTIGKDFLAVQDEFLRENTIHTFAGIQLRLECAEIMKRQGHEEGTGFAKITNGWNLPARYMIHTVGPIIHTTRVSEKEKGLLASCYRSCLAIAGELLHLN